jgi:succinate dehydrogenase/fumarate reductase cytochrome b subunit
MCILRSFFISTNHARLKLTVNILKNCGQFFRQFYLFNWLNNSDRFFTVLFSVHWLQMHFLMSTCFVVVVIHHIIIAFDHFSSKRKKLRRTKKPTISIYFGSEPIINFFFENCILDLHSSINFFVVYLIV